MERVMLAEAAELLAHARRVVIFTGAGMSAESGVPTFRDDLTGLWARYDAARLATPEAFHADPDLVWGWYEWRRARVRRAWPNPGHLAVAALGARLPGWRARRSGGRPADAAAALRGVRRVGASRRGLVRGGAARGGAVRRGRRRHRLRRAVGSGHLRRRLPGRRDPPHRGRQRCRRDAGQPAATPLDKVCAVNLRGSAAQVLPALLTPDS